MTLPEGNRGGAARRRKPTYLPREVFFGRLGLVGVFFSVWPCEFGRFPVTSGSFPASLPGAA